MTKIGDPICDEHIYWEDHITRCARIAVHFYRRPDRSDFSNSGTRYYATCLMHNNEAGEAKEISREEFITGKVMTE